MPYYSVVIDQEPDDGEYTAWAPALPDCRARGETMAAAIARVQSSLTARLERLAKEGRPPPDEGAPSVIVLVEVAAPQAMRPPRDLPVPARAHRVSA